MTRREMRAAARRELLKSKKSMKHMIHGGAYRPPRGEYNAYDAIDGIERRLSILEGGSDEEIADVIARETTFTRDDYMGAN